MNLDEIYSSLVSKSVLDFLDHLFYPTPASVSQFSIYESKDFGDLNISDSRRAIIDTFQTTANQTRESERAFQRIQDNYISGMSRTFNNTIAGRQGVSTSKSKLDAAIESNFMKAYLAGRSSTGSSFLKNFDLTKEERSFIKSAAQQESKFAKRFLDTAVAGEGFNEFRMNMYKKTIESMFTNGWLSTLPEDTLVYWELHARESCPDCIVLAAKSPYSLGSFGAYKKLPTVPRAGSTVCLSNCKCTLKVVLPDDQVAVKDTELFFMESPLKDTGLVKDNDFRLAEDLTTQMNQARHEVNLRGRDKAKEFIQKRTQLNQQLIDLQNKNNTSYIPRYSVRDIQKASEDVKGLQRVSFANIVKDQNIVLLRNSHAIPAVVKSFNEDQITFISAYGDFIVTANDDFLYFTNEPEELNERYLANTEGLFEIFR